MVVLVWVMVAVVIGLYVLFVVWRVRVDRRKKAMLTDSDSAQSSAIARAASAVLPTDPPARASGVVDPLPPQSGAATTSAASTVADALRGIKLPSDLAPLTTMAPRGGVGDRVAFWTTVPAEIVGPAFGDELERLGYTVSSLDEHTLAAQRDDTRLIAIIHPDAPRATVGDQVAFESVPELSVVIEVWIPL